MARIEIPVTRLSRYALAAAPTPTTGDATNGHYVLNDGSTFFEFRNNGASSRTIDILISDTWDSNLTIDARTYTLPASAPDMKSGIFPTHLYGRTLLVNVSHSDVRILAFTVV